MKQNIQAIWRQVQKDDVSAWRQVVDIYASLVATVARRVGLSELDAEDCAQDVWLALYRRRQTIKNPQAIPAWLIRTTHRQAVHMARRTTREHQTTEEPWTRNPELPDEMVQELERRIILKQALDQLDRRCRTLIEALYMSDGARSYRQLARRMGLAPNSIGSLRSRCLKKLQGILRKIGYSAD